MTSPTLIVLLDTLLPGDPPLPSFSQAGIDPSRLQEAAGPMLAAMDQAAFISSPAVDRMTTLLALERSVPDKFRAFLSETLAAYYQAPAVLAALGWHHQPPQPTGHHLAAGDDDGWQMLDKVRRRGALWRS